MSTGQIWCQVTEQIEPASWKLWFAVKLPSADHPIITDGYSYLLADTAKAV